jgi:hypothetical protein
VLVRCLTKPFESQAISHAAKASFTDGRCFSISFIYNSLTSEQKGFPMRRFSALIFVLVTFSSPLQSQTTGTPIPISLPSGSGTLTLDFANNDYELILYSGKTDASDSTVTYSYTVSTGSPLGFSNPTITRPQTSQRDHYEYLLRQRERDLSQRIRERGWLFLSPRIASKQAATTRTFSFEKFGGVTSERTITATLISSNNRAVAYIDNALPSSQKNISEANIETMLNAFSASTFDIITNMYGEPSDVDNDGKVVFLFTHLVDEVGGVAGFYSSGSLFSKEQGGDGNLADMMFISPTRDLASYTSLLAHEFQHLISFNQHVLLQKGDSEETWLNEGLSHVAEDLVDGHIDGGNTDLVSEFMDAPGRYALTGDASLNLGIRGAAYLFVQGLMESFGSDVPGRLVKSGKVSIANVEDLSGQPFDEVYRTFASRLFLSGNTLNSSPGLNYSFRYFTEPQTSQRSLPLPKELKIDAQNTGVAGAIRPASTAFIRLTGSGLQNFQIQSDVLGDLRGMYVPLPKNFIPALSLPVDFFQNITLDAPFSAVYTTGETRSFSGSVGDASITQILLTYEPRDPSGEEIRFSIAVTSGRFNQSVIFAPSQAGEYILGVFAGTQGDLLPQVGRFPRAIVSLGDGAVSLQTNFFNNVTLSEPLPGQYKAGQGVSLAGQVTDTGIEIILLVFTPKTGGEDIRIQTSVINGSFRKGFLFTPEQAGSYDLDMFGGPAGGNVPRLGGFTPIVVTSTGNESILLPVDLFDNIVLNAPLNTTFIAEKSQSVSGTVTDPSITQVAISFAPSGGGSDIDHFVDVINGQFSADLSFTNAQVGLFEMLIFGGPAGQSLPFLGRFTPVGVVAARPAITLANTSLAWSDVREGMTQSQALSITNTGSQTLNITQMVSEPPFSVAETSLSILPGEMAIATVIFSPISAGSHSGSLQILSNDLDSGTQFVTLLGTSVSSPNPVINLPESNLTWPSIPVGQSQNQGLTISNSGMADLTVIVTADLEAYTLSDSTLTIAPGDSVTLTVTFSPQEAGTLAGIITLVTNDPNKPTNEISISGVATTTEPGNNAPTPDFDGNGTVGFSDFLAFSGAFGSRLGTPTYHARFDLDGSGDIGFSDFLTFASAYGKPA